VQAFPPRTNSARVIAAERAVTGEAGDEAFISTLQVPGGVPENWRLVIPADRTRATVAALWIDGKPSSGGLARRIAMARDSLAGSAFAPVLVSISTQLPHPQAVNGEDQRALETMRAFLMSQPKFSEQIAELASAAAR